MLTRLASAWRVKECRSTCRQKVWTGRAGCTRQALLKNVVSVHELWRGWSMKKRWQKTKGGCACSKALAEVEPEFFATISLRAATDQYFNCSLFIFSMRRIRSIHERSSVNLLT